MVNFQDSVNFGNRGCDVRIKLLFTSIFKEQVVSLEGGWKWHRIMSNCIITVAYFPSVTRDLAG